MKIYLSPCKNSCEFGEGAREAAGGVGSRSISSKYHPAHFFKRFMQRAEYQAG